MNKTAIKNFAISARKKLIAMAQDRAGLIGITADQIAQSAESGSGFAVYPTHFGTQTTLTGGDLQKRASLVRRIGEKGYESVMEEVAYTWFNRLIAVRFMEVNDYLPTRVRVLSSEREGKLEPDLVTEAPKVDLGFTNAEVQEIYALKDDPRKSGELFKKLFIKQCNALGEILPKLFEQTADYTELLLDIAWDKEDGVVRELLTIDEADFREAVEIIGWMYQYYNTEPKQDVFDGLKKNVKITKEKIPAATQLFTPDWIVRYMVENSLGRVWLDHLAANGEGYYYYDKQDQDVASTYVDEKSIADLKTNWKYYLPEAKQEPDVEAQLSAIRVESAKLAPEDIKVIDPCMGSGHILVYAFDVLMQIYVSCGYAERDAAALIVEKNLYGLDIDKRAYQLAYFAVMMKGRQYDRRFFTRQAAPQFYCPVGYADGEEFGSLLLVDELEPRPEESDELTLFNLDYEARLNAWNFRRLLAQQYDVVITNPPYMGSSGMSAKLSDFVKKNFPDSKADLFACFIERCGWMTAANGYTAMITQHAWMFLSSFEKLRSKLLHTDTVNMAHLGARAFEEIGGEVVQTTSWVQRKGHIGGYQGTYARLVDHGSQTEKENAFLAHSNLHTTQQENFSKIPGSPIAYWVADVVFEVFQHSQTLEKIAKPRQGLATSDNDRFLRFWHEVSIRSIGFDITDIHDSRQRNYKWFPCTKGGSFRRWYGNNEYVINWENDGREIKDYAAKLYKNYTRTIKNISFYFRKGLSWSTISSGLFSLRYVPNGFIFETKGAMCYVPDEYLKFVLGLYNTKVVQLFLGVVSPTLDYHEGPLGRTPILLESNNDVDNKVEENIHLSKSDWDSFETSWDFKRHPLICSRTNISDAYSAWQAECESRFQQLKANEEELNRIFIDSYGLQDELTPEVEDKDISVRRADLGRDIRSLVSYAVGCMFGRYSLDVEGLAYAGGGWDGSKYRTFLPDADNVLPITDDAYFPDDIVTRFIDFVKVVYGADTLEENLAFVADALGNKGASSREVIRNYFLKDFYKDHCKTYHKRPIYWLFDSGKQDGFKALIYLHRYDQDTVGRVRADYLHKQQGFLENAIANCDYILQSDQTPREKAEATKKKDKLVKQLAETRTYDQALAHIALQRIPLDLDGGVKVNYEKFQGIEVKNEGTKPVNIDLLAKL